MERKDRAFSIHEFLVALLRDQNIHEGHWGLTVQFRAHGTSLQEVANPENKLPGMAIAVAGVTLVAVGEKEQGSVDASLVNPVRPKARARKPRSDGKTLQ